MATATLKRKPTPHSVIPPLENGDLLPACEFERRYEAMPGLKKAELLEGVVFVPSPVSTQRHGEPHADLMTWLGVYKAHTPGVRSADNATIRLDEKNEPQPDGFLFLDPECGGQASLDDEGYVRGGPELAAEVAGTTASLANHLKRAVYQRFRLQEYVIWRVQESAIDWFVRQRGQFRPLAPEADGIHRSRVFSGLWLDAAALVAGDLARVLDVLHAGLASPAHAAFVEELRSRRA